MSKPYSLFRSLLVGVALMVAGPLIAVTSVAHPDAQPYCNGQLMTPDEICNVTKNGVLVHRHDYYEQLDAATKSSPGLIVLGIGLALVGLAIVVLVCLQWAKRVRVPRTP